MTITPVIHIENGIRSHIVPARIKIWSPTFEFEGIGIRRLFLWTHADFWWFPEKLNLDPNLASEIASQDIIAFETISLAEKTHSPEIAQKNTPETAADFLSRYCNEFRSILNNPKTTENAIHQWLFDERHYIFLDPHAQKVWSKLPFGSSVSDFVVQRSDATYRLIEIENSADRIFQKSNSEPTARFNHACQQVRDWQRYIRDNVHTVRHELGLTDIYEPSGAVIMGRTSDIDSHDASIRWYDIKNKFDLDVYTYDEIVDAVGSLANTLRIMLKAEKNRS